MEEAAGGDDGTDILVGVDDEPIAIELVMLIAPQVRAEGIEGDARESQFVGHEAFAKVGNDQMDFAAKDQELFEHSGSVGGPRSAGDPEDNPPTNLLGRQWWWGGLMRKVESGV